MDGRLSSSRGKVEHIELLPSLRKGTPRPQLQRNNLASSNASTSASVILGKKSTNERTAVIRNGSVNRRFPVNRTTVACHQHNSYVSRVRCTAPEFDCTQIADRYVPSPIDVANLSVYKNNDCIILPAARRHETHEPRQQCFYCGEWYQNMENTFGSCSEAPDPVERIIRMLTCYPIAQGAVYHCCRGDDDDMPAKIGRFGQGYNVCSCGPRSTSLLRRLKRWLFVSLISLLVPCLCCYLPAHLLYKCCGGGRRGRHQPCRYASNS